MTTTLPDPVAQLGLLGAVPAAGRHGVEIAVLVTASLLVTVLRFSLPRTWVFRATV